jgi:hypothetical protein
LRSKHKAAGLIPITTINKQTNKQTHYTLPHYPTSTREKGKVGEHNFQSYPTRLLKCPVTTTVKRNHKEYTKERNMTHQWEKME